MTDSPPDTHDQQDQPDPPVTAASVVGAVRTENARAVNVKPTPEQFAAWLKACTDEERVDVAGKMLDAQDRAARCFEMDHYRNGERVGELLALVDELTAQRDLARDAAVALEQENARLQNEREAAIATLKAEARAQMEGAARRDRSWPGDVDVQRLTADAALRARAYRHAAEIVSPAAVLGLGLQPETSEQ